MNRDWLLARLEAYRPMEGEESRHHRDILAFVTEHPRFHDRTYPPGHVTGSAWVVNTSRTQALLLHHGKLGRWLQPGGHMEDDANVLETALREAREETGMTRLQPVSDNIFDVDIHYIPPRKGEAGHLHYDIRFLLCVADDTRPVVSSESRDVRWFNPQAIFALNAGPSIERMVLKVGTGHP